ncbi:hypothetical protein [Streptomyces griseochromogenes]|uniref:hypothetical protein n=1 Tax=Streptomyces griseochromogenes TaxID=68214 RepID=UPI0037A4FC5F
MTRTAKIVATVALALGAAAATVSPALADNHQPVSPEKTHATVIAPQDKHMP